MATTGRATQASEPDDDAIAVAAFRKAVNRTAAALLRWLETAQSKRVGSKNDGDGESVDHHSGRGIVGPFRTPKADLSAADIAHMRKVVGFVHRHLAQRSKGDVSETPWRFSLMNWGHDPAAAFDG